MAYKPSEARYDGGGQVRWLVYSSPQPLANGRRSNRIRVKRYFPADARKIKLSRPAELTKRTGRKVFGAEVHYEYRLAGATARRGGRRYEVPARWASRTKIVELPGQAKGVRLTDNPPEGPKMDVA